MQKGLDELPMGVPGVWKTVPVSDNAMDLVDASGIELRLIPAGSFIMGASRGELEKHGVSARYAEREFPCREIAIERPFAVAKYPVTRGEFAQFVTATGKEPGHWCEVFRDGRWVFDQNLWWRDPGFEQADDHPVVAVSWHDAQEYLDWLGTQNGTRYRLLSSSEYEYATRAGSATAWFWGNEEELQGLYANGADLSSGDPGETFALSQTYGAPIRLAKCFSGFAYTSPVGSFLPNAFGLYDMLGNVWEWVADCYIDGVRSYSQSPLRELGCSARVIRGGSWAMSPTFLRSAAVQRDFAWHNDRDIGFRVARDVSESESLLCGTI